MKTIAGVLIKQDGKYLLVQEKLPHVYGLWNLPAGHVDPGETKEEAAKREAKEETGYRVKLIDAARLFTFTLQGVKIYIYPAKIISGEIKINPEEVLDVKWFTPEEIKKLSLREPTFKDLFV